MSWSHSPYRPLMFDAGEIYVCRVAPGADFVRLEWLGGEREYSVYCARRGSEFALAGKTRGAGFTVTGLEEGADYMFFVEGNGKKSGIRLARTGKCVGNIVNYLHFEDKTYAFSGSFLCSPCLLKHPDGYLLASMDVFGHDTPQNLTLIFRSDDDGASWRYLTELMPCFWGRMFLYENDVYMLACSTEYGDLLIGRSTDGGASFCEPTVLLRGSGRPNFPGVHKNPQPTVEFDGRIWETLEWGAWRCGGHAAMVMSAPLGADLLDSASWTFSEPLAYDPAWQGAARGESAGCIEGTLVIAPDARLKNIMRYDMTKCEPNFGRALVFDVTKDKLVYERAMEFPANHSKFEIRFDAVSGFYYSIASRIRARENAGDRNLLSLMKSRDLIKWETARDLIDMRGEDARAVGFQYVDFMFDGGDIIYLCRTATNGAHNYHDSNYSTFHRVRDFRRI